MYCRGGCAASPSSAIRPCTQLSIGSRSNMRHHRSRHMRQPGLDRLTQALEGGVQLVGGPPVLLAGQGLRRLEHRHLVEHVAAAQRVLHEVAPRPDVQHDVGVGHVVLPHHLDGDGAAVGDVRRVDRLVVAEQLACHGVQAVRGDDEFGRLHVPVGEGHLRPVVGVGEADGLAVRDQVDAEALAGAQQGAVQVAAVDDQVGEAVLALQIVEVEPGELGVVDGVAHHHGAGLNTEGLDLVEQAELVQDPGAVGGDLHPRPDFAEGLGSLEKPHLDALPGQGDAGGEAADATAHDEDVGSR